MNNNIFKDAKFGDKFLTRDGRVAIFWFKPSDNKMSFIVNNNLIHLRDNCPMSNQKEDEIVSRYQEPSMQGIVDEEKLDKLANDNCSWCDITDTEGISGMDLRECFKAGYRKAMEG